MRYLATEEPTGRAHPDHDQGHGQAIRRGRPAALLSSPEGKSVMKKKVRYAAGALGALGVMPALGLVTPAAAAAAQAPARTGKTVSMAPLAPATTCTGEGHEHSGISQLQKALIVGIWDSKDNGCIGSVWGTLLASAGPGWWLRIKAYSDPRWQTDQKLL
jgi:hypothetical protein